MAGGRSIPSPEDVGASFSTDSQQSLELPDWAENARRNNVSSSSTRNDMSLQPHTDFDEPITEAPENNTGVISPWNVDRAEEIQSTVIQRKISTGPQLRQDEAGLELKDQAERLSESNLPFEGQRDPTQLPNQGNQIHSPGPKASNGRNHEL